MNILVLIKQVPGTESEAKINDSKTGIEKDGLDLVLNPNDEFAMEEALKTKEKFGGEITAISLGPDTVKSRLRTCLAMGADKSIHLLSDNINGSDSLQISLVLANAIKDLSYDVIFCGSKAVDTDNGAVGIQIAEMLGIPHVASMIKLEIGDDSKKAVIHRQAGDFEEIIECELPALFTCQKGLNEPRSIKLPNIMKAKKQPLEMIEIKNIPKGVVEVIGVDLPPEKENGRILEGTEEDQVKELATMLKQKTKGGQ